METGDLATWVTGLATLAAVLTTLYLSFYEKRFTKKKDIMRTRNAIKILSQQELNALVELQQRNGNLADPKRKLLPESITYNTWLLVNLIAGKPHLMDILIIGQQINDLLKNCTEIDEKVIDRYKELMQRIDHP